MTTKHIKTGSFGFCFVFLSKLRWAGNSKSTENECLFNQSCDDLESIFQDHQHPTRTNFNLLQAAWVQNLTLSLLSGDRNQVASAMHISNFNIYKTVIKN